MQCVDSLRHPLLNELSSRCVELGAHQCSLVVLSDTEAHFLWASADRTPSFAISY